MKKLFLLMCLILPYFVSAGSQSKYIEAMKAAIDALFQSENLEDYQAAANTFERIGLAEQNEWYPYYYLALTRIFMSTQNGNPKDVDVYLDQAQEAIDAAILRHQVPDSEITALQGFILMLRIPVDPATRGPQLSGAAMQKFSKAVQLNLENPRAHYLLANMQMGTAQFFGNGISEACVTLDRSIVLFENQIATDDLLAPIWGKEMAASLKKKCEQE
jgi:hypothetical protein